MSLNLALQGFVQRFKNSDQAMGLIELSQEVIEVNVKNITISGQLEFFYKHIILKDKPTLGGDFYMQFYELHQLEEALVGWRWIDTQHNEDLNWNAEYTIFAERNGDVLFCDCSLEQCPVYGSIQKENYKIADSLESYFNVINIVIDIEENEFNNETVDDDFNFMPGYLLSIKNKISNILGGENVKNFMKFYFD